MLSGSTVFVLGVLWAIVLLPRAVKDVRTSPVSTVTGFSDAMARLAVADQRLLVVPSGSGRSIVVHPKQVRTTFDVRRRRTLLLRLLAATGATAVLAVVVGGGAAWAVASVSLAALIGYCVALRLRARRHGLVESVTPRHPSTGAAAAEGAAADAPVPDRAAPAERRATVVAMRTATVTAPVAAPRPVEVVRAWTAPQRAASTPTPPSAPAAAAVSHPPTTLSVAARVSVTAPAAVVASAAPARSPAPTAGSDVPPPSPVTVAAPAVVGATPHPPTSRPIPIGVAGQRRLFEDDGEPTGIWDEFDARERVLVSEGG